MHARSFTIRSGSRLAADGRKLYDQNAVSVSHQQGRIRSFDDESLNQFVPEDKRRNPFRNMIYIGDGLTDVPCMKLVKTNGGKSIAVYQNGQKEKVDALLRHGRVDFVLPADYSRQAPLFAAVKNIIVKMAAEDRLVAEHMKQLEAL
jgi:hypothetical protein